LLGRGVGRRALTTAHRVLPELAAEPQIAQLQGKCPRRLVPGEKYVLGLDVAVYQAVPVEVTQGIEEHGQAAQRD
jgi:hypothetical protein